MTLKTVHSEAVKQQLARHDEMAFIDVREHGEYGESHPFHSVNIPFSRFEVDLPFFVPSAWVMLVVFDAADEGRARQCAKAAMSLGYQSVYVLEGGARGWAAAGFTLFAGVNVPSKTFGEIVEHHFHTPSISATTLAQWQAQGKTMTVLDGRTEQEYHQRAIPQAQNCPNGELSLRAQAMLVDATAPVVVHCAGRTRSLVGAETLRQLAPHLQIYALENGTQGWELAGFEVAQGLTDFYPKNVHANPVQVAMAQQWAERLGLAALSIVEVQAWLGERLRTTYVFDIRTQEEFAEHPFAGAVHAPGGQLLQATDLWVGVRFSCIILLSNDACRAPVIGAWLAMMGFTVGWYQGTYETWQEVQPFGQLDRPQCCPVALEQTRLEELHTACLLIDVRTSSQFQQGHYEGSYWLNRSSLPAQMTQLPAPQPVAIVAASGALAQLVAAPLRAAGYRIIGWLKLCTEQSHRTVITSYDRPLHQERIDYLYFVHDRHMGNLAAAKQYLAWELGLVEQLDDEERSTYCMPTLTSS